MHDGRHRSIILDLAALAIRLPVPYSDHALPPSRVQDVLQAKAAFCQGLLRRVAMISAFQVPKSFADRGKEMHFTEGPGN